MMKPFTRLLALFALGFSLCGCLAPIEQSPVNVAFARKCGEATVYGLDVPLTELSDVTSYGVSVCPLFAEKRSAAGVQMGGLFLSSLKEDLQGVQMGLLTALNTDAGRTRSHGVQFGFTNQADTFTGVQLGAMNLSRYDLRGAQVALAGNYATGYEAFSGLQASVLMNIASGGPGIHGAQVAAINVATTYDGVQIGLKNRAVYAPRGLQLGLFNVIESPALADTSAAVVQIGLLNWDGPNSWPIPLLRFHFD